MATSHHCHESIPRDTYCTNVASVRRSYVVKEFNRLMRRPSSMKVSKALFLTEDMAKCIEDDRSLTLFYEREYIKTLLLEAEIAE